MMSKEDEQRLMNWAWGFMLFCEGILMYCWLNAFVL